jgi:hypothetical protein
MALNTQAHENKIGREFKNFDLSQQVEDRDDASYRN